MAAENSSFHCSAEWHIARLKFGYTSIVYGLALKVSGDGGFWHADSSNVAAYLDCTRFSIIRANAELEKLGFFVKVRDGSETRRTAGQFSSNTYKVLSHETWAAENPGKCTAKLAFPWSGEARDSPRDRLGLALYKSTGYHFGPKSLNTLLKFSGKTEAEIVEGAMVGIAEYARPLSQRRLLNLLFQRFCPERFTKMRGCAKPL